MFATLQVTAIVLTAIVMALALAHALELPGKRRLSREHYLAVQTIYYPGFTYAGAAEPLAIVALLALLAATPTGGTAFWLAGGALAAAALTHLIYWTMTAPVNKRWLAGTKLSKPAQSFFGGTEDGAERDWTALRDRWEQSHLYRTVTAAMAFVLVVVAAVEG